MGPGFQTEFWKRMARLRESEEHRAYHGHIFGCPGCRPQVSRYCPEGFELWAAYQVPIRAAAIVEEPELRRRRAMLDSAPEALRDLVAAEVKRLWYARQAEKDLAR